MLRRLAPELQLMLLRTTPGLSGALRRDIEQLCAGMAEQATPALRRALVHILRDVRDPAAVQNIIALRGE
jgi:hypothetical protein